jgi:hypothetical protein
MNGRDTAEQRAFQSGMGQALIHVPGQVSAAKGRRKDFHDDGQVDEVATDTNVSDVRNPCSRRVISRLSTRFGNRARLLLLRVLFHHLSDAP